MCLAVYVGAPANLPLIPWIPEKPGFHVRDITAAENALRPVFGQLRVYYTGSHDGCGCGFQLGTYPSDSPDDLQEKQVMAQSLRSLAEYLSEQLKRVPALMVYSCWEGEQSAPAERAERVINPGAFLDPEFYFVERELLTVRGT